MQIFSSVEFVLSSCCHYPLKRKQVNLNNFQLDSSIHHAFGIESKKLSQIMVHGIDFVVCNAS